MPGRPAFLLLPFSQAPNQGSRPPLIHVFLLVDSFLLFKETEFLSLDGKHSWHQKGDPPMPGRRRIPVLVAFALFLPFRATTGMGSEAKPIPNTSSERYDVPKGDVTELVGFIRQLSSYRPTTVEEDVEHRTRFQPGTEASSREDNRFGERPDFHSV